MWTFYKKLLIGQIQAEWPMFLQILFLNRIQILVVASTIVYVI